MLHDIVVQIAVFAVFHRISAHATQTNFLIIQNDVVMQLSANHTHLPSEIVTNIVFEIHGVGKRLIRQNGGGFIGELVGWVDVQFDKYIAFDFGERTDEILRN